MQISHLKRKEYVFTLRLWVEEITVDQTEWRGRLYDATTGDERYFRDWSSLIPLLLAMLRNAVQKTSSDSHFSPNREI